MCFFNFWSEKVLIADWPRNRGKITNLNFAERTRGMTGVAGQSEVERGRALAAHEDKPEATWRPAERKRQSQLPFHRQVTLWARSTLNSVSARSEFLVFPRYVVLRCPRF